MARMTGFDVPAKLARLNGTYPPYDELVRAAGAGSFERAALSRLWIAEGIPFAFNESPAVYEAVREWLGASLGIEPKSISIRGSGRLGYSLTPIEGKRGQPYREGESDLDLFAVSRCLFCRLKSETIRWVADYSLGNVGPRNRDEARYWRANKDDVPRRIRLGFLDSDRVPIMSRYPHFQELNALLYRLRERLMRTEGAPFPGPKRMTLRCYRSWAAFQRQQEINLRNLAG